MTSRIRVRRVYDPPEAADGTRVLVDRLWPRGLSKDAALIDSWPKALTPSNELRRWYHDGQGTYEEFRARYDTELAAPEAARALDELRALAAGPAPVTLLTAVKDPEHSHVQALLPHLGA
ncbi:DUF488 family protein [Streptomyces bambusae]|uniref:DUF488 domain-containing protein n=1 Tax=Streptomyces bambusae TaxID=1550616 RepID=UPI001CFFC019|nr:DUF488 family protein [Streptomyces bambusae]MCB5170111.1 DUF488 family protein [Streptomyces bambusae]